MRKAMETRMKNPDLKPKQALQIGGFTPEESLDSNRIRQLSRRIRLERTRLAAASPSPPAQCSLSTSLNPSDDHRMKDAIESRMRDQKRSAFDALREGGYSHDEASSKKLKYLFNKMIRKQNVQEVAVERCVTAPIALGPGFFSTHNFCARSPSATVASVPALLSSVIDPPRISKLPLPPPAPTDTCSPPHPPDGLNFLADVSMVMGHAVSVFATDCLQVAGTRGGGKWSDETAITARVARPEGPADVRAGSC